MMPFLSRKRDVLVFGMMLPLIAVALFYLILPSPTSGPPAWIGFLYPEARAEEPMFQKWLAHIDTTRELRSALTRADSRERAISMRGRAGLTFRADSGVTPANQALVEQAVRADLAELGVTEPRYPIAVIAMVDARAELPRHTRAVVMPEAAGDPCTVVVRMSPKFKNFTAGATDRILGTCGFFAAYGAPGAGMLEWLVRTNARTSSYAVRPVSHADGVMRDPGLANVVSRNSDVVGCRAERTDACLRLFDGEYSDRPAFFYGSREMPEVATPMPQVSVLEPTQLGSIATAATHGLLAGMAEDLGAQRFTQVWTDAAGPVAAYERVASEPLTTWLQRHLAQYTVAYHAGPSPKLSQWIAMVLVTMVAAWLAPRFAKRHLS